VKRLVCWLVGHKWMQLVWPYNVDYRAKFGCERCGKVE